MFIWAWKDNTHSERVWFEEQWVHGLLLATFCYWDQSFAAWPSHLRCKALHNSLCSEYKPRIVSSACESDCHRREVCTAPYHGTNNASHLLSHATITQESRTTCEQKGTTRELFTGTLKTWISTASIFFTMVLLSSGTASLHLTEGNLKHMWRILCQTALELAHPSSDTRWAFDSVSSAGLLYLRHLVIVLRDKHAK